MERTDILLSVIIPCKNEEKNIERCIRSVIDQTKSIQNTEILVVDSVSTDKSIEKAKKFPVSIIQLKPDWFSSPASARYLGCLNTIGKYIFVIDADMELLPGFLERAIDFLDADEQIAGVAGMGAECYEEGGVLEDMYKREKRLRQVKLLAGAALFKRSALELSGYFNPFLKAEEEHELCVRLDKAGFKLFTLPQAMIKHYTSLGMDNFERRLKAGMFRGIGQMFRLTFLNGVFSFAYLMRFRLFLGFVALLVLIAAAFFTLNKLLFVLSAGIIILLLLFSCYIKGGGKKGFLSLYKWILINTHILRGMFERTPPASSYPQDVIVIKKEGK